jgi:hypothetical protein
MQENFLCFVLSVFTVKRTCIVSVKFKSSALNTVPVCCFLLYTGTGTERLPVPIGSLQFIEGTAEKFQSYYY